MQIVTTFKGDKNDLENYKSIVVASNQFSIANDYTFSNKQIEELAKDTHDIGHNIYVLCNKMIFDEEIEALVEHLTWLKSLDITGIYFADMAVYMVAKDLGIEHLLIYAPGMTVVNSFDVKEYLDLNIQAVELANELTLDEKLEIAHNNPDQVGVVISGYLLMSYTKRKTLTNYFKAIDKNVNIDNNYDIRLVEKTREGSMPIYEDDNGSYIYSEYVFHSYNYFKQLLEAPFKYFRIDGIFLDKDMILDIHNTYDAMLLGREENFLNYISNKYKNYKFDDRFYYTKTSEVK